MQGVVVEKNGAGIPDVEIQVNKFQEKDDSAPKYFTNADGNFKIGRLHTNKKYDFTFSKDGYKEKKETYDLLSLTRKSKAMKSIKVQIEKLSFLKGVVIGEGGEGIPDVFVSLQTNYGENYEVMTGDNGEFEIQGLEDSERYRISLKKTGYITKTNIEYNPMVLGGGIFIIQLDTETVDVEGRIMIPENAYGKPLFVMEIALRECLDNNTTSPEFREQFRSHNIYIPSDAMVNRKLPSEGEEVNEWQIAYRLPDEEGLAVFVVKAEDDLLNVYSVNLVPFEGVNVKLLRYEENFDKLESSETTKSELKRKGKEIMNVKTNAEGKFRIRPPRSTGGNFYVEIINDNVYFRKYTYIPSDKEYFELKAGDSVDLGEIIIAPSDQVSTRYIKPDTIDPGPGPGSQPYLSP